jgi:hypothetical protein
LISLVTLPWVVARVDGGEGSALVHVTEPDVQVSISGRPYLIEGMCYVPIECALPAGHHRLEMTSGGVLLYREEFEIRPGEQVTLTAWRPRSPGAASVADRSVAPSPALPSAGLESLLDASGF